MNPGMKMLLLSNSRGETRNENRSGYDREMRGGNTRRYAMENTYNQPGRHMGGGYDMRMGYDDPESRFRDRRGREHYDNGRYAPKSFMEDEEGDEMMSIHPMGFSLDSQPYRQEMRPEQYRYSNAYAGPDEMEYGGHGQYQNGHASGSPMKLDKKMAEEWTSHMENEDGTKGPHWTLEQVKQVMAQRGIDCDPLEFWVALNAVYSDYSRVFRKHGVGEKIDFYADMAKAFIEDKDAQPDKLARYYRYVVKH